MTRHEEFAEEVVRFALGELSGSERDALASHLEECPACRQELAEVQESIGAFSLTALGPAPPARSRERLLKAIQVPPAKMSHMSRPRWMFVPALASVFLALVAILLVAENFRLRNELAAINLAYKAAQAQLVHAETMAETLTAPDAVRISLVSSPAKPQPECRVFYLPRKSALMFIANNLAPQPSARTYELWAIPSGAAPVPAGTFNTDTHGSATLFLEIPGNTGAKTFAITVEPEGGSPQPTSTPILVGS